MILKKPKLVKNWRSMWKATSVQIAAAGAAITSYLISDPNAAQALWNAVPPFVQSLVPPQYVPLVGVVIFTLSIPARVIHQNKISGKQESNEGVNENE